MKLLLFLTSLKGFAYQEPDFSTQAVVPPGGRPNIYGWQEDERKLRIEKGRSYALIYPVSVSGVFIPYDAIKRTIESKQSSPLSKFFYNLDRGTMFRTPERFRQIFAGDSELRTVLEKNHRTFPGLYLHGVFVLSK